MSNSDDTSPLVRPAMTLALLSSASFLNSYDRSIFPIILEPMKRELALTDTQVGLLVGPAFAILFAIVSIPMASFADKGRRAAVLAWAMGFWSLMTALCGLATGFATMALGRFGVGAGEGGGGPSINALAADAFGVKRLATVLSVIVMGSNIGAATALLAGGWLTDAFGWRCVFLVGGAAGLFISLAIALALPRPTAHIVGVAPSSSIATRISTLFRRPAFALLCAGIGLSSIALSSFTAWGPAFFIRKFHVSPGEVGRTYGIIHGCLAILIPLVAGLISDRLARLDPRWPAYMLVIILLLSVPANFAFLSSSSFGAALFLVVPVSFLQLAIVPPYYALVQLLAGPQLRSSAAAVSGAIIYLMGYGLGPPLVGLMSDTFGWAGGANSLERAMMLSLVSYFGGAAMFWLCARHVAAGQHAAAGA
ncbi:MFS transporter [Sphingomonas sp.]|uniref:MFS transporter n=1 Tax=Sphingomonas sp. TaxID=28214 RepID=UPI0025FAC5CC|nr:MFS transporter [Sphingomonas sp.]